MSKLKGSEQKFKFELEFGVILFYNYEAKLNKWKVGKGNKNLRTNIDYVRIK